MPGVTPHDQQTEHTVSDMMLTRPTTLAVTASVGQARRLFDNDHVHLVLLTEGTALRGTLIRDDLAGRHDDEPAIEAAGLEGRTIAEGASMRRAHQVLTDGDARRLAVVDTTGALVGLLCLKRRRTGFCSDDDVAERRRAP